MITRLAPITLALAAFVAATPALAGKPLPDPLPTPFLDCKNTDVSPTAMDCSGWFAGNLINSSPQDNQWQQDGLALIGLAGWTQPWLEKKDFSSGNTITFATVMSGITYVGVHLGAANGATNPPGLGNNGTAFFKIDFTTPTNSFTVNYAGLSNAALYATQPVPEPGTYALLLAGLGALGFVARRRKRSVEFDS